MASEGPVIITHMMERGRSSDAAIASSIKKINSIVGRAPSLRRLGKVIDVVLDTGPCGEFVIGQSHENITGLTGRGAGKYSHFTAIVLLYETDGIHASGRVDAIEKGLIKHFKEGKTKDKRCTNKNAGGGGGSSNKYSSRNVYVAIRCEDHQWDDLWDALKPEFPN